MPTRPFVQHILVLGHDSLATAVAAEMRKHRRYRVLADVEGGEGARALKDGRPFAGSVERGLRSLPRTDRIVVAVSDRRGRLPVEALLEAKRQGIAIEEAVHVYERLTGKLALDQLQPSHLIFSADLCRVPLYAAVQRALSVGIAAVGLTMCAPLMAAIAVLVKWDSDGPVLFVQERIGKDGRRFPLLKFRTMHPIAERCSEWVKDNGDRITRVGRWLRKFRLDELPQLFNVLLGHMNLIGPRPHPASNYDLFMDRIPFYAFRSMVLPGITGWAQVCYGYANSLEEETEKMCYDLYYIKHCSLLLDLHILFKTIKVVCLGQHKVSRREAKAGPEPSGRPVSDYLKKAA